MAGTSLVLPGGHSLSGNSSAEPWKGKHVGSVIASRDIFFLRVALPVSGERVEAADAFITSRGN